MQDVMRFIYFSVRAEKIKSSESRSPVWPKTDHISRRRETP